MKSVSSFSSIDHSWDNINKEPKYVRRKFSHILLIVIFYLIKISIICYICYFNSSLSEKMAPKIEKKQKQTVTTPDLITCSTAEADVVSGVLSNVLR